MGMIMNGGIRTALGKLRLLPPRLPHRRRSSAPRNSLPCLVRLRAVPFRPLSCRLLVGGTTRWRPSTRSSRTPPRSLLL
ncbi:hypothetical protein CLIM01_05758, partial [Colletotrichum limetticola]